MSLSADGTDLGSRPSTNIDSGTYQAEVVIPRPGDWQVQVSVRTGEFTNPVLTLPVTVDG
jgi:copper transport protein